ncbi:MAG: CotH kinase family protein [Pseudomonadota bacterium]
MQVEHLSRRRRATLETYLEVLESHFALDELLATWAVELYVGDIDSYITHANNFCLYHQPTTGTWPMIPWGADQSFQAALDPHDPYDLGAHGDRGHLLFDAERALLTVVEANGVVRFQKEYEVP